MQQTEIADRSNIVSVRLALAGSLDRHGTIENDIERGPLSEVHFAPARE
jgi:hypothetical protein